MYLLLKLLNQNNDFHEASYKEHNSEGHCFLNLCLINTYTITVQTPELITWSAIFDIIPKFSTADDNNSSRKVTTNKEQQ